MNKNNKYNRNNTNNKYNRNNTNYKINNPKNKIKKNTEKKTCYSVIFVISVIRPETISDHIKCWLFVNPNKTIKEIARGIKEKEDKIRTNAYRNPLTNDLITIGKIGLEKVYSLSESARQEIELRIKQFKKSEKNRKEL